MPLEVKRLKASEVVPVVNLPDVLDYVCRKCNKAFMDDKESESF